jgi:hypothetical protein
MKQRGSNGRSNSNAGDRAWAFPFWLLGREAGDKAERGRAGRITWAEDFGAEDFGAAFLASCWGDWRQDDKITQSGANGGNVR